MFDDLFGSIGDLFSGAGNVVKDVMGSPLGTLLPTLFGLPPGVGDLFGGLGGGSLFGGDLFGSAGANLFGGLGGFNAFSGLGDFGTGLGGIDFGSPAFGGIGGFSGVNLGGASIFDKVKQPAAGGLGRQLGYGLAGLRGLNSASKMRDLAALPNPADLKNAPGYQAGMDAVTASMAQQGYTGGSNAAAAMGKYGADFYNQYVQQRRGGLPSLQSAGVNEAGSLALLAKAFGLF